MNESIIRELAEDNAALLVTYKLDDGRMTYALYVQFPVLHDIPLDESSDASDCVEVLQDTNRDLQECDCEGWPTCGCVDVMWFGWTHEVDDEAPSFEDASLLDQNGFLWEPWGRSVRFAMSEITPAAIRRIEILSASGQVSALLAPA